MLSLKELRYFMSNEIKLAKTLKILDKNSINKKNAFTLAETLITLTIIGVIAALTIPNLISKYQKHSYVVGLKKAYSQLQNAMKMIPITQGCPAGDFDCVGWDQGGQNINGNWASNVTNIEGQEFNGYLENKQVYLLSKQFKINKLCYNYNNSTDKTCEKIKNNFNYATNSGTSFVTNDGMIWNGDLQIIDINGFRGPNKLGRDQFSFFITDLAAERALKIPMGLVLPTGSKLYSDLQKLPTEYWKNNNYCTTENVNKNGEGGKGAYCAGRVLEEDAMNY